MTRNTQMLMANNSFDRTPKSCSMTNKIEITNGNPALATLQLEWGRAKYTAEDGIGPLDTLHKSGDAIVAIAGHFDEQFVTIGSGVMVAPGLMLTATHVSDEFPRTGS